MTCPVFPVSGVRWIRGRAFCNSGRTLIHAEPVAVMYRLRIKNKAKRSIINSQLQQMAAPPLCFM